MTLKTTLPRTVHILLVGAAFVFVACMLFI